MYRTEKEKEANRLRQKRFYNKRKPNGQPNKKLISPSSSSSSSSDTLFIEDSLEIKLSKLLFEFILKINPKAKKPNFQTWAKHIDLAIRVDGRTPEELEQVIRWCQADDFWYSNILSTQKLRKQFDQLWVKMNALQEPKPESKPQLARSPVRDNYVPKPPLTPEEQKRADIEKEKFFKAIEKMGEKKGME